MSGVLIKNAMKLCELTKALGGDYVWEWLDRWDCWGDWRVEAFTANPSAFTTIASSAVNWHACVGDEQVYIKKMCNCFSTDPAGMETFSPFHMVSNAENKTFVDRSGRVAKASKHYPT